MSEYSPWPDRLRRYLTDHPPIAEADPAIILAGERTPYRARDGRVTVFGPHFRAWAEARFGSLGSIQTIGRVLRAAGLDGPARPTFKEGPRQTTLSAWRLPLATERLLAGQEGFDAPPEVRMELAVMGLSHSP